MTIGERLKEWRKGKNLKTTEIANSTGLSTGGLSEYENDKKLIGTKTLLSLYREYNIDINWILTGEKKENVLQNLNENEKELLEYFRKLPPVKQAGAIAEMKFTAEQYKSSGKSSTSEVG